MEKPIEYGNISWLSDSEYKKAVGQFRLGMNGVFVPFHGYGLSLHIPSAIAQATKLTEDFGLRVRGVDKIISFERIGNGQLRSTDFI